MRKIVNKKMYNTNTAVEIASCSNDASTSDFNYYEETLYKKKTGEFFLYGEGNAASKYSRSCGTNNWCGGWAIKPMTNEEAREWMEKYGDVDKYIEVFGEPEE